MDNLSPEQAQTLDEWSEQIQTVVRTTVEQGGPAARRVKNWLNGVWLGHALHPALTDMVIGAWWTGFLLDIVGPRRGADVALSVGVLAAVPTALSGAADWSDTEDEQRRVDQRVFGFGLSTIGLALTSFSAWLGGELVFRQGTSVNRNAWLPTVDEFHVVASADALEAGKLVAAELEIEGQTIPLVLLKKGRSVLALSAVCSHWGGPLAEGKLVDGDCVECPWHASRFNMNDGSVQQGPATAPQPVFEARVRAGNVEVRRQV